MCWLGFLSKQKSAHNNERAGASFAIKNIKTIKRKEKQKRKTKKKKDQGSNVTRCRRCRLTPSSPDVRRASAAAQSRAEPPRTAPGIIAAAAAAPRCPCGGIARAPICDLPWEASFLPPLGIKLLLFNFFNFFFNCYYFLPGEKEEHRGLGKKKSLAD